MGTIAHVFALGERFEFNATLSMWRRMRILHLAIAFIGLVWTVQLIHIPSTSFVSNRTSLPVRIRRQQAAPRVPRNITLHLPLFHRLRRMKNGLPHIIDVLTVDFYARKNAYDVDVELRCMLL